MTLELRTLKWDMFWLDMAEKVSTRSKDPSTKVGSVIVGPDQRFISLGYNGLPEGDDDESWLIDREIKYETIIHGELNAILFAEKSLEGATIYTYPFLPCSRCASVIRQKRIARVVSFRTDVDRWLKSINLGKQTLARAKHKIEVVEYENG